MIQYNSDSEDHLIRLLIDYTFLKSRESGLIGIFLLPYFDDKNIFEVIQFFDYEPLNVMDGTIDIGNDEIRIICLNKDRIKEFEELSSCEILYDPQKLLSERKKELLELDKVFKGSNQLNFSERFKERLHRYICCKVDCEYKSENDLIYQTLIDYYYCILYNENMVDDLNFELCISNITNRNNLHFFIDNPELHRECLEESIRHELGKIKKNYKL